MKNEDRTPQQMKEKIEAFRKTALNKSQKRSAGFVGIIISVLSDLIGGLLVGAGLGYLFMKLFDAHVIVLAIFILLGGFAGLLNVYRSAKNLEGQNK